MSGDVQPRKRKDKKRKKDELGVEEPRGTAAALGEGDVFIHSQHDHGTGGHWCAKIIFFSLLVVLITLVGLIILENRGLSELEANSVESRYSGVLEGWLEDAPDDDHHDEHTLELNHPDDDEDDHGHDDDNEELEQDQEDEHEDEDENEDGHDEEDELDQSDNEDDDDEESNEQQDVADSQEENDEDDQEDHHRKYYDDEETENDDDEQQVDESEEANENSKDDGSHEDNIDDSTEDGIEQENELKDDSEEGAYNEEENTPNDEDEDEHDEEDEEDTEVEVERIEKEIDLEPISTELPALPEDDDDDDNDKSEEQSTEEEAQEKEDDDDGVAPEDLDDDFLEDDTDEPPIERITAPVGKPLVEVEEEDSLETPPDTLAEEEEYEKQQDEKKREEEKSSHMWLKLTVGGALLVATHALVRRATAPRDSPTDEERSEREETPLIDRRMTLIPDEPIPVPKISTQSYAPPVPQEEIFQRVPVRTQQTSPPQEEEYEDDEEKQIEDEEIEVLPSPQDTEDKELYSDEEVEEEEDIKVKKEIPKLSASKPEEKVVEPEPEPDDEDPDDVEIIDDEQLEEEDEEEDDEEEISDVDDAELLSRLEAKYGRLPEPERPGQKPKDGGNSIEDEWPGEPSDSFWRQELDSAEDDLRRGSWSSAAARASSAELRGSARARWLQARAADMQAEAERDNRQLGRAIAAYLELLKMHERLPDDKLRQVAARALDRIMFRGNYLSAEPVYKLLIRRFPDEVAYRNNLTISYLMANRADLAEEILKETLQKWPNDRVALAHYGFVLKTLRNRLEEAVEAFQKALEGDSGPANEPRFYYHLGDALLLLGRPAEAHEVHKRGAKLGHFLSPAQRSLYNVPQLKGQAWWNVEETPYAKLARALEKNWKEILKEGEAAKALYEKEKEGLKERGDWSQLDLFARGQEIPNRCKNAPVTCSIVRSEPAAVGCRRGQIKFSAMVPGTHVRPHVGPTNCRLRMHLALSNTKNTFIRVDQTVRQWQTGKVLMFDDSFEHEVWHNGTGTRLVLIVDVWHPDLTPRQRRSLPAI